MEQDIRYLTLLSKEFPSVQSACAEIIKLEAIRSLPKGTEHFMSDIHGEHEAFLHILNNASGAICEKIEELFESTLTSYTIPWRPSTAYTKGPPSASTTGTG